MQVCSIQDPTHLQPDIDSVQRIRRVKCDETKPACLRCTQTGRKCDGYSVTSSHNAADAPPEDVKENPNTLSKSVTRIPLETSSFYFLPFKIPGSQNDRQLFHYFCVHASLDLAGFSCASSDFWGQIVLECSHYEPVVRSALLAVASIHRSFATKEAPGVAITNPLKEYNIAIRRLRKHIGSEASPKRKVVLVCCALFYCFDSTRGRQDWAITHLNTALSILNNTACIGEAADSNPGTDSTYEVDVMKQFFSRLDAQAAIFEQRRVPSLELISQNEKSGRVNVVPLIFTSLSQAEIALDKLGSWTMRFLASNRHLKSTSEAEMPAVITQERQKLNKQFERWEKAVRMLMDHQDPHLDKEMGRTFQNSISVFTVQLRCYSIAVLTFCTISHADQVNMNKELEVLLEEIEHVLYRESLSTNRNLRSFSCNSGIITALYYISCKSSGSRIRQRALQLLSETTRREGIWDAQIMEGMVRNMMGLELNGANFPENEDGFTVDAWATEALSPGNGGYHTLARPLHVPIEDNN